jgi:hypothetical protein
MTKSSTTRDTRKTRATQRKTAAKAAAKKGRISRTNTSPKIAAGNARAISRSTASQFEAFRHNQVPEPMRALAGSGVAQTREFYERSKDAVQGVLETWQKSFGAAGQGAVALNRKIFDIAERNINNGFDLATGLAGAKNLAEVMELQTTYWRKQLDQLKAQAEDVRALSTNVTAKVVEPMKAQVTRFHRAN